MGALGPGIRHHERIGKYIPDPGLEKFNDVTECFTGKYRGPLGPRYFRLKHEVTSLNSSQEGQEVISHTSEM